MASVVVSVASGPSFGVRPALAPRLNERLRCRRRRTLLCLLVVEVVGGGLGCGAGLVGPLRRARIHGWARFGHRQAVLTLLRHNALMHDAYAMCFSPEQRAASPHPR